jgi:hypothetical protein
MGIYTENQPEVQQQQAFFEELILTGKRPSLIPLLILRIFTIVFVLFPFLLVVVMSAKGGFHPKYLFGVAIATLPGVFFLRLLLWNLYGREVIRIEVDGIRSFCDYKYFLGRKKKLIGTLFYCDLIEMEHSESEKEGLIDETAEIPKVKFGIRNEEGIILSHFHIPIPDLEQFFTRVNSLEETLPKMKWGNEE